MRFHHNTLVLLPGLAAAITPPNVDGMSILWSDDFKGPAGGSPNTDIWNIMDAIDTNAEVQTYTTSNSNLQTSGGETIQFVPRKSGNSWTSGRIETKASFTPEAGKVMMLAANILVGGNAVANKQGLWPAFWALGDAIRHGTEWPACGEIDIMEQVNGALTGYGTVHCGSEAGGPCNEPNGRGATVGFPSVGFHTWSVKIDLTNDDWQAQSISWQLDGVTYSTLTGAALGDQAVFSTLAHSPLYLILNVAVGGNWPGPPNDATLDGYGAMMEVAWVAAYSS
ncbi:beta-glucanase [Xylariomycetidae sp. FL2044]|nr:beta-glucanase [Xylariomycetidae sp. FL2044]